MVLLGCYLFIPKGYDAYKKHQYEKIQKDREEKALKIQEEYDSLRSIAYMNDGKRDPHVKFLTLKMMCEKGNCTIEDMINLAICYYEGKGTYKDNTKAIYWFSEARWTTNNRAKFWKMTFTENTMLDFKAKSIFYLGYIAYEQEEYFKASKLFQIVIDFEQDGGYRYQALNMMGLLYYQGYHHIQDTQKAIELWEKDAGGRSEPLFGYSHFSYSAAKNLYEHYKYYDSDEAEKWKKRIELISQNAIY